MVTQVFRETDGNDASWQG